MTQAIAESRETAAAKSSLVADPDATIGQIAQAAGLGRVTLYGHYPNRGALVDAVFARVVERAESALTDVDRDGDPGRALHDLAVASWRLVHDFRAVRQAAERELPPEHIHRHHENVLARVERLIRRGQDAGTFRGDLPTAWLVATCYGVMHTAADEVSAGRLPADAAGAHVAATLQAALTPPGTRVPRRT